MKEIENAADLRTVELGILKHVDEFCQENNIQYFLGYGTLLGAIRHKGFIPWDDDIDIFMHRKDFERFIKEYSDKDRSQYEIRCYSLEDNYPYPFAKISDSSTILIEYSENPIEHLGINIDLFPMDVIPDDSIRQRKLYAIKSLYHTLINLKIVSPSHERIWYKNVVLNISQFILRPIPLSFFVKRIVNNAMKYHHNITNCCAVAVWGYGMREINNKHNWDKAIKVQFESLQLPVPIGYDDFLTAVYGDYMQLPPEEKRVTHHAFKAYWKNSI